MKYSVFVALSFALVASARPRYFGRADFTLQNGKDAIALNQKFATLNANSPCQAGENACVGTSFAQCVNGKFITTACAPPTICAALPLVNSAGTSVTCTTAADRDARIAATGATAGGAAGASPPAPPVSSAAAPPAASSAAAAPPPPPPSKTAATSAPPASSSAAAGDNAANGAAAGGNDPQKSLTLLDSVIAKGFELDGQQTPAENQVASLTSSNNFINFCVGQTITNGAQVKGGSCNPAPMGVIAAQTNMPASKFVFPPNGATVPANTNFTIKMAIKNLETGNFVNAAANYFAAPQQVNAQGNIIGHSHVVIDPLPSLGSTVPVDPANAFVFFKGLNEKDQGGVLSVEVPGGLPVGAYRLASINAAANHQPVLVAVAQHGALDDMVYFTVA